MNIYEECPVLENDLFLLRMVEKNDIKDLLKVYSDINAVPLFNSDNCNGDDFHYETIERMSQAVDFWADSYKNRWFVRWSIVCKKTQEVIGTIEGFHRESDDTFNGCGVIRLDIRSDYEKQDTIEKILSLILPKAYTFFDCNQIITKSIPQATERIKALENMGFIKSQNKMIGTHDRKEYDNYWTVAIEKNKN